MILLSDFNWKEILLGSEEWSFLGEVVLRTAVMFLMIILSLKILGKRGVKQLSIFELVVIIGFGSAAGDPMIYKDVGIIPSIISFLVIITVYRILTHFIGKYKKFETFVEGRPLCLIREGAFAENFLEEALGIQELLSELRLKGVSQLGQVQTALEEISGEISVFFYPDEEVKYGLPIMPEELAHPLTDIETAGHYSCSNCGHTEYKFNGPAGKCSTCKEDEWVSSSNRRRIS
ncbi:DUF421 domain-containing protein [Edaphocola aurantiacus]|uniref:DUF421 domain-containing protein n=1 Tax=Edaphocola aurantiacus TaxID=2601682 RepID=UPI001C962CA0|nr:YetF domain-containing protein [Edaphocola aurantiacus]